MGSRLGSSIARNRPVLASAFLLSAACGATRAYSPDPGPYDRVPGAWRDQLQEARFRAERGDPAGARALLEPLARARPKAIPVAVFLQEVELALLEQGGRFEGLAVRGGEDARAALARHYEARAQAAPTAEAWILAARLAQDGERALELLAQAQALDPACSWVHYGRAWWFHALRRFREAREEVRAVQRANAGHLPTLRLHAAMLAGVGEFDDAAGALEAWLDRTADDPLYAPFERADALLDLAALAVLRERPKKALDLLEKLDPRALRNPSRAEEVRAAAHETRGEYAEALAAVHRANRLSPREILPLVQEAMLLSGAGDLAGEKAVWERLLERTEDLGPSVDPRNPAAIDFESLLFRVQAHARIERIERELP